MSKKYSIGLDFGTLSGRALIVDVEDGNEIAVEVYDYPHKVMEQYLPDDKTKLKMDWALQFPNDYLEAINNTIPILLKKTGINPCDVIGLGIDFTACTILPIYKDGMPLCNDEKFMHNPHAYVKLWKHHSAQYAANQLNKLASDRNESFLKRYGGKISSEWVIPKIMQIVDEAPEIYDAADRIIEATDWIVMKLTGKEIRSNCTAGFKAIWSKREGYPSKEFFKELNPRLENVVEEKLGKPEDIRFLGEKAGELTEFGAKLTGLMKGTAVSVGNVDAHVAIPALGITEPGKMLMIMGTSTCDIMVDETEYIVPGMCGVVDGGVLPGYFGYESGQSCVGDHFAWFTKNCVPAGYVEAAKQKGISIQEYLMELAQKLKPGESGLIALDWWNGNRSVLVDMDLTGMILGMTLQTKPEEIYRALIEATAFGKRVIIDTFKESGVNINELYACGGIVDKNPMMMQIYSDVCNMDIKVGYSTQAPALGSAIFGALAAGSAMGGYDDIKTAAKRMGRVKENYYKPIPQNVEVYSSIYKEFKALHDYFGTGANDVMKRMKKIKEHIHESI